jgi:hypothetical protein
MMVDRGADADPTLISKLCMFRPASFYNYAQPYFMGVYACELEAVVDCSRIAVELDVVMLAFV